MKRFSHFSMSAASYLLFLLAGMITLSAEGGIEAIAANPAIFNLGIDATVLAQIYTAVAGALLVIKCIHSVVGGRLLALPCLIGDIAFISLHNAMVDGAGAAGAILLLFFIILSAVSLIPNGIYTLFKNI